MDAPEEDFEGFTVFEEDARVAEFGYFVEDFVAAAKERGDEGEAFLAATGFQDVEAVVDGDAVNPRFEGGAAVKFGELEVDFYEHVLGGFFGVLGLLQIVQTEVEHHVAVLRVHLLECGCGGHAGRAFGAKGAQNAPLCAENWHFFFFSALFGGVGHGDGRDEDGVFWVQASVKFVQFGLQRIADHVGGEAVKTRVLDVF